MKRYAAAGMLILLAGMMAFGGPPALMKWQDTKRLGKGETETAESVQLALQTDMTLFERMELLNGGRADVMALVNGKNYNQDSISDKMQEEIQKLEELGILSLNGEKVQYSDSTVLFYVDTEDAGSSMMIWRIAGFTSKCQLNLIMDDETGKVLSVVQSSREAVSSETSLSEQRTVAERWGEYLGCSLTDTYRMDEEAGLENYDAWGYPEEILNQQLLAVYEDGAGTETYLLQFSVGEVIFSAEIFR